MFVHCCNLRARAFTTHTVAEASAHLFSKQTQALMYNFKPEPVQRMLDFDYMCGRDIKDPSLAGLITPGSSRGNHKVRSAIAMLADSQVFYGTAEKLIPVYGTVVEACQAHPGADVLINFASFRRYSDLVKIFALYSCSVQCIPVINGSS